MKFIILILLFSIYAEAAIIHPKPSPSPKSTPKSIKVKNERN